MRIVIQRVKHASVTIDGNIKISHSERFTYITWNW